MEERVRGLILSNFPPIPHDLASTDLLKQNGFTSLMFVELILLLEKEFRIEILDEEIGPGRFSTVERIADFVQCKLGGKPIPPLPVRGECASPRSASKSPGERNE